MILTIVTVDTAGELAYRDIDLTRCVRVQITQGTSVFSIIDRPPDGIKISVEQQLTVLPIAGDAVVLKRRSDNGHGDRRRNGEGISMKAKTGTLRIVAIVTNGGPALEVTVLRYRIGQCRRVIPFESEYDFPYVIRNLAVAIEEITVWAREKGYTALDTPETIDLHVPKRIVIAETVCMAIGDGAS